ncbi:PVC-type heme-binding CxxCH protein [Singulisphaera acidiphila]|uniref:Putative membrane-bound dehydrogenase n=1 Tax=Singulisphaera acidiphila (strain ATCC BAA-1392 / DSM 18658 / VKM B-2454 / MOB10) TaxID=886293 RepID=L0D9I7_SINAD|nr:PVC-type heme-binding CxxCH protein [Singulisphaera acidiphila]AGA25493.1 putative membrane-bound dehydrogenase [Singulisphaera acidiphila DSM 18658]
MPFARFRRIPPAFLFMLVLGLGAEVSGALPKVPEGFEVRLVATVPAVLYPCQVGTAPDGALFVAEDPMDQIGPYEANHGRILLFRDGKDPVVFADGFRAIQGMAWHDGALYVSHMPFLSVIRDSDGDDKAESRKDLFKDLGPTDNRGLNDHIVSGIQFGMDGYLYISVGDKGIPKATGPDGRTIQIVGGGTCRCRPDGTGLEVVSTGTRNHLEPNLDDRDNLFTYDNTDDGLGWWTRVTHHVDGGYYGYPYDYHNRPDRHLPRMAEYGGGSPCGAVLYKEDAWPEKYHGVGFWAEWGKGKVHAFRFAPDGATFKVVEEIDFAVADGLSNFRPIDLALSHDGRTLYVADWGMGGWGSKTEKVGRVFAITYKGQVETRPRGLDADSVDDQIKQLDHPAFSERMRAQAALIAKGRAAFEPVLKALNDGSTPAVARRHLIWAAEALAPEPAALEAGLAVVLKTSEPDLRAQAIRALGQSAKPARPSAVALAIGALDDLDPVVRLQAVIALGRLGHADAVRPLLPLLAATDDFIALSARQALRRIGDWKGAASGLSSDDPKIRAGLLAAMELVYEDDAARALAEYANDSRKDVEERARAVLYLSQVDRKARPWDGSWWGTRPAAGKPPAKVVDWEQTPLVLGTLRSLLSDQAVAVRLAAVTAVRESRDREALPALRLLVDRDPDTSIRVAVAKALGALEDKEALPGLIAAIRAPGTPEPVRDAALEAVETIGSDLAVNALLDLLETGESGPSRRARLLAALGRFKAQAAVASIVKALGDSSPEVRSAAAEALGKIGQLDGVDGSLRALLADRAVEVRKAAIVALGTLADREAIPALLAAVNTDETRFEATVALAAMPDLLALQVYLAGLADKSPDLRKASADALTKLQADAAPVLDQLAARRELPPALVPELRKIYTSLQPVTAWQLAGPFEIDAAPPVPVEGPVDLTATLVGAQDEPVTWKKAKLVDKQGRVDLHKLYSSLDDRAVFAYAEVQSPSKRLAPMVVGSDDTLTVWLNGKQVYDFQDRDGFRHDRSRFDVSLVEGTNRILVKCGNRGGLWQFAVALATPADYAFLKTPAVDGFDPDGFRAFAMKGQGKAERGRSLFQDLKGLACIRCHAVGKEGGAVGPELSSIGAKYPRHELITSVLFPSAQIASGYEPVVVATEDGRVLTGIIKSDTPEALEIEDADAKRIRIPRDQIDDRKRSEVSLMPTGLAEGLSKQDFADLIAYLETLKETPAKDPSK